MFVLINSVLVQKLFKIFLCIKQVPLDNFNGNIIFLHLKKLNVFNVFFMYYEEKNAPCLIRVFIDENYYLSYIMKNLVIEILILY